MCGLSLPSLFEDRLFFAAFRLFVFFLSVIDNFVDFLKVEGGDTGSVLEECV